MAQSSQVQQRGLAVGQSWATYLAISEATVHWIHKCAHQLLAWKHVGSVKQGIFSAVVEVLIRSVVSSLAAPWARGGPCCAGLRAAQAAAGSEGHNQGEPVLFLYRQFPRSVFLLVASFQSAWKELPFCTTLTVEFGCLWVGGCRISLPGDRQHNQ